MKVDIRVTEILSRVITVDTNSIDDAINNVEDMYKKEQIVLDYTDFDGNVIIEKNEDNFVSKKI